MTTAQDGDRMVVVHHPYALAAFTPRKCSWYSFLLEAGVWPQGHSAIGRILCKWKIPMTPAGIKPVTYRFVAQHLNHCATAVPKNTLPCIKSCNIYWRCVCEHVYIWSWSNWMSWLNSCHSCFLFMRSWFQILASDQLFRLCFCVVFFLITFRRMLVWHLKRHHFSLHITLCSFFTKYSFISLLLHHAYCWII